MNRTLNPIHIELVPSRLLGASLVAAYGAALTVVFVIRLPVPVTALAVFILLSLGWRDVARCLRSGSKQRIRQLVLRAQADWIVTNGAGVTTRGRPTGVTLAHPWMVSFNITDNDGKHTPVLVLPDMTSRYAYHGLLLWLRQNSRAGSRDLHD